MSTKDKIQMQLELFDLSDIDNKLLIVKTDIHDQIKMEELVKVFVETLHDMNKELRVAFVPTNTIICKDCPKEQEHLKDAKDMEDERGDLIPGKKS